MHKFYEDYYTKNLTTDKLSQLFKTKIDLWLGKFAAKYRGDFTFKFSGDKAEIVLPIEAILEQDRLVVARCLFLGFISTLSVHSGKDGRWNIQFKNEFTSG